MFRRAWVTLQSGAAMMRTRLNHRAPQYRTSGTRSQGLKCRVTMDAVSHDGIDPEGPIDVPGRDLALADLLNDRLESRRSSVGDCFSNHLNCLGAGCHCATSRR